MSKKEGRADKMKQLIQEQISKAQEHRQKEENDIREREIKHAEAARQYNDWVKKYKSDAIKAADIIWTWCQDFIASDEFKELAKVMKSRVRNYGEIYYGRIYISSIIESLEPYNPENFSYKQKQSLGINSSGELYVHNCVKYGKSYPILEKADLSKYVAYDILIKVAGTIHDGSVWHILRIV